MTTCPLPPLASPERQQLRRYSGLRLRSVPLIPLGGTNGRIDCRVRDASDDLEIILRAFRAYLFDNQ